MEKRYIFVPRELFGRVLMGDKHGQLHATCPECHDDIYTQSHWVKRGALAGGRPSLDFIECTRCAVRLYPETGSFTLHNTEIDRAKAERAHLATKLYKWDRWKDARTSKERGRVRDAVSKKVREMGLTKHTAAQMIVRGLLVPHQTQDGHFHQPEIYTLQDIAKLDHLWDILEDPFPFNSFVGNQDAVDEAWHRTRG